MYMYVLYMYIHILYMYVHTVHTYSVHVRKDDDMMYICTHTIKHAVPKERKWKAWIAVSGPHQQGAAQSLPGTGRLK